MPYYVALTSLSFFADNKEDALQKAERLCSILEYKFGNTFEHPILVLDQEFDTPDIDFKIENIDLKIERITVSKPHLCVGQTANEHAI